MRIQEMKVRTAQDIKIRAVKGPDQVINGIIRLTGSRGTTKIWGICTFFQANPQSGQIYIDDQSMFFCGSLGDLVKNYNRNGANDCRLSDDKLIPYVDHPYSSLPNSVADFYRIPIAEMRLGTGQQALIDQLMEQVKADMPEWVRGLVHTRIDLKDKNKKKSFDALFRAFPNALKEAAIAAGSFYLNHQATTETGTELLHLPTLSLIYTPMGGLPPWAKANRRRI